MKLNKDKNYNILFIGNSYTYYNDMPISIFAPVAESMGYKFNVKYLTKGGWRLINSANPEDELGALVEAEFNSTKYDFVVLQEQSISPIIRTEEFFSGVRKLAERATKNGATPMLYATWGRKSGCSTLDEYGWTHESMTWKLSAGYKAIADELGLDVAYVGIAFNDIFTNSENITDVYFEDLSHPSYSGSYLAAITIFSRLTDEDPKDITFNGELSSEVASVLKDAAKKAVFETPDIPSEY